MSKLKIFGSGLLCGAVMFGPAVIGYWLRFGFH